MSISLPNGFGPSEQEENNSHAAPKKEHTHTHTRTRAKQHLYILTYKTQQAPTQQTPTPTPSLKTLSLHYSITVYILPKRGHPPHPKHPLHPSPDTRRLPGALRFRPTPHRGFQAIDPTSFMRQSETIEAVTPEISVARTAVASYFTEVKKNLQARRRCVCA